MVKRKMLLSIIIIQRIGVLDKWQRVMKYLL